MPGWKVLTEEQEKFAVELAGKISSRVLTPEEEEEAKKFIQPLSDFQKWEFRECISDITNGTSGCKGNHWVELINRYCYDPRVGVKYRGTYEADVLSVQLSQPLERRWAG